MIAITTTYALSTPCQLGRHDNPQPGDAALQNHKAMNHFLAGVERQAFRMAEIATGSKDDALDLVQDAMMSLVKNYARKPEKEWGPLFHRILQSKIRDHYRRSSVRNKIRGWLGFSHSDEDTEQDDPIQSAEDIHGRTPQDMLINEDSSKALQQALKALPLRQQQAFLLRNWQAMSVKDTAYAMGCSEGSVKTHYSRAIQQLRTQLEEHRL